MPLASMVGWGGVLAGSATSVAQLVRIRREGVDGVNATTWSLFTVMAAFWLCWGVAAHSSVVVAANLVGGPILLALLAVLPAAERRVGLWRGAVAVGVTTVVPTVLFGWNAGLVGIGVLVVATRIPQLVQLVTASHARGVSTTSWVLGSVNVALWLGYYLATARAAAALPMAAALATNLAIVALSVRRHRLVRAARSRRVWLHPSMAAA